MWRALAAIAMAGCFHPTVSSGAPCVDDNHCPAGQMCIAGHCGGGTDAAPHDTVDAPPCAMWKAHHFDACAIPPPGADIVLTKDASPYQLDASAVTLLDKNKTSIAVVTGVVDQGGTPALLLSVGSLSIEANATLRVIGMRPVIVAAAASIAIDGELDAGSYRTVGFGAGANPAECATDVGAPGQDNGSGAGGGGGGGFQGAGG